MLTRQDGPSIYLQQIELEVRGPPRGSQTGKDVSRASTCDAFISAAGKRRITQEKTATVFPTLPPPTSVSAETPTSLGVHNKNNTELMCKTPISSRRTGSLFHLQTARRSHFPSRLLRHSRASHNPHRPPSPQERVPAG